MEFFPKMRERVANSNLKAGMPIVEKALEQDLCEARECGAMMVRIIHGYGASGRCRSQGTQQEASAERGGRCRPW